MADEDDEEKALRAVALQNAQSIFLARQQMERELMDAKEVLERKTGELAQQHEWFRVTLSSIGDAVIATDVAGGITFLNPAAEKMTGWSLGEAHGQPIESVFMIINEETFQPAANPIFVALRDGVTVALADRATLIAKDGTATPIEDSAAPIRDGDGKVIGAVTVFHDVTARRRTEEALAERARLEALRADVSTALISGESLPEVLKKCTESLVWHLGVAFARIWIHNEPESMLELFASAGADTHLDHLHSRVKVGESEIGRIAKSAQPLVMNDGLLASDFSDAEWAKKEGVVAFAGFPMLLGDAVLGVMAIFGRQPFSAGVVSELTPIANGISQWVQRKRAEEARSESEARFRSFGDSISQLAWCAHANGFIHWYNRRWYEYTGTTPEQMEGWGWQSVHDPAFLPEVLEKWQATLSSGEPLEMEFPLRGADGKFRTFLTRVAPQRDAAGNVIQWFGTNTDISYRIEFENLLCENADALRLARDSAEAATRAKDEFLAALSHELRTPLTPVLLLAAEMEQAPDLPETVRSHFAMIRKNVELQARIIDDLLDLTRITHGKLALRLEVVDVHGLVEHALAILLSEGKAKGITIVLELNAAAHHANGDAVRLQQVFWNVLKNAIKFTPQGGRIAIRSWNEGPSLRVATTDSGMGITPEEMPRIFTAFEQGREAASPRFGGLGLGLSITALLVREHHGRIWAESAGRDQGSTFHFEIPTADAPAPEQPGVSPAAPPDTPVFCVLLVEDHEDTRAVLRRLMTRWGHSVATAGTVAQARQMIANGTFNLLISDVGLPDGTGFDVIGAFREKSDAPAIAMSGYGMETDLERTQSAGFAEHLIKPISMESLREMLTRFSKR